MNHRNNNLVTADDGRKSLFRGTLLIWRPLAGISLLLASAALTLVAVLPPTTIADSKAFGISNPEMSSGQSVVSTAIRNKPSNALDKDWWSQVQRGLAEYEYHASENNQGLQAPNRAHNLRIYFDAIGISIHDRTKTGSPELAELTLIKLGRASMAVAAVVLKAAANAAPP